MFAENSHFVLPCKSTRISVFCQAAWTSIFIQLILRLKHVFLRSNVHYMNIWGLGEISRLNIRKLLQDRKIVTTDQREILSTSPLLAFTDNSAAQSSAQTHIHSAIVVIDTSNNAWHSQVHWLVETPYLAVKASNVVWATVTVKIYWHLVKIYWYLVRMTDI